MDFHGQKVNLSFSIENILREDFSQRRTQTFIEVSTCGTSDLERWPNALPYQCCAVHFGPAFVKCLPNMQRVEHRLQRSNFGPEDHFLKQKVNSMDEKNFCKEEATQTRIDESTDKKPSQRSKSGKCITEKSLKRKRRNRSHFTQRQLQYLDKIFSRQQYLTRDERTLLARGLEMTELQIRNWFQNRRYQKRHRANEEKKQDQPDTSVVV